MDLENEVLKKIVPTLEDRNRIDRIAEKLKATVQAYLDANGIQAELRFVGSYAKDTFLSDPDLDLFVMFPYGTSRAELEILVERVLEPCGISVAEFDDTAFGLRVEIPVQPALGHFVKIFHGNMVFESCFSVRQCHKFKNYLREYLSLPI